ncbi:MAG: hypothetical protein CMJ32_04765 [Phycisphaerae bacterium]|nr:hypothetical protein [Phycisphaerae bacterium]
MNIEPKEQIRKLENQTNKWLLWSLLVPAALIIILVMYGDVLRAPTSWAAIQQLFVAFVAAPLVFYGLTLGMTYRVFHRGRTRRLDHALRVESDLDIRSTTTLMRLAQLEHEHGQDEKEKAEVEMAQLRVEVLKARNAGASDEIIAAYLQGEIDDHLEGAPDSGESFEPYRQLIRELRDSR